MFAPLEHEEDGAENLVANGDDGAFIAAPDNEGLELRLEHGRGATGGMSELTEQTTDIEVALADMPGLSLGGGCVVAGTSTVSRPTRRDRRRSMPCARDRGNA